MLKDLQGEVLAVPLITVPPAMILERMSGRISCRAAGHVYHLKYNPPKVAGICDTDGSELYQREDDKVETVQKRIQVYEAQTAPLIEYYQKKGLLKEVDGTQELEAVTKQLLASYIEPGKTVCLGIVRLTSKAARKSPLCVKQGGLTPRQFMPL